MSLADPLKVDRLPPHALESEQGILGCVILSPDTIVDCITTLKGGPLAFYDLRHRTLYECLLKMFEDDIPVEVITIQQFLKDRQQLDGVGGISYIASLPDSVPSSNNISYYIEIVNQKFNLRTLVQAATNLVASIYEDESLPLSVIAEDMSAAIQESFSNKRDEDGIQNSSELVMNAMIEIEELSTRKGALTGIPSGLYDLDRMTHGFQDGNVIIIAARTSVGKTSLAMSIANHVACEERIPTGVFSLEMSKISLIKRMICARAQVNMRNIADGFLAEEDKTRMNEQAKILGLSPLKIDGTRGITMIQVKAKMRQMATQGVRLFIIDYLGKIRPTNINIPKNQQIADTMNDITSIALELNVPIIVLAQLNRDQDKEKNREPRLSDLRDSGAIEQDADVVILLHRSDDPKEAGFVDAIVAKQRSGPTGKVRLEFKKCFTRFDSVARLERDSDTGYLPAQDHEPAGVPYKDL